MLEYNNGAADTLHNAVIFLSSFFYTNVLWWTVGSVANEINRASWAFEWMANSCQAADVPIPCSLLFSKLLNQPSWIPEAEAQVSCSLAQALWIMLVKKFVYLLIMSTVCTLRSRKWCVMHCESTNIVRICFRKRDHEYRKWHVMHDEEIGIYEVHIFRDCFLGLNLIGNGLILYLPFLSTRRSQTISSSCSTLGLVYCQLLLKCYF